MSGPATEPRGGYGPGVGGYVLAVAASAVLLVLVPAAWTLPSAVADALAGADPGRQLSRLAGDLWTLVLYLGIALLVAAPVAVVFVPLVHLACRHHARERWHVAAAGLAGLVCLPAVALVAVLWGVVTGGPARFSGLGDVGLLMAVGLLLGPATALGRACVIPLSRRRARAATTPTATSPGSTSGRGR